MADLRKRTRFNLISFVLASFLAISILLTFSFWYGGDKILFLSALLNLTEERGTQNPEINIFSNVFCCWTEYMSVIPTESILDMINLKLFRNEIIRQKIISYVKIWLVYILISLLAMCRSYDYYDLAKIIIGLFGIMILCITYIGNWITLEFNIFVDLRKRV